MGKIELAIFDFDGTLADSFPFFISNFNHLAEQHGFSRIDLDNACAFRGYSARQMMQYVGLPQWKLPLVARNFMGLMKENSHRISVFDGVSETLRHLDRHGIKLAIVTSNSHENVSSILGRDNMALIGHLESGASIFGKASRIARVLNRSQVPGKHAIYIGDQVSDLEAAHKAKLAFGAVAWGYATLESLIEHQPEYVFRSVSDIESLTVTSI
jgi:phosphoglycolate phosphatase